MLPYSKMGTVDQPTLVPNTSYIVQVNGRLPVPKHFRVERNGVYALSIAELSTDHVNIRCAPAVVTDSTPHPPETHLHTPLVGQSAPNQTNLSIRTVAECYRRENTLTVNKNKIAKCVIISPCSHEGSNPDSGL